jgi:hypothetical protein
MLKWNNLYAMVANFCLKDMYDFHNKNCTIRHKENIFIAKKKLPDSDEFSIFFIVQLGGI